MRLLLLVIIILSIENYSQQWIRLTEPFSYNDIKDISFKDYNTGFLLVGNEVFKTTDAGENFYKVFTATNPPWGLFKTFFFEDNIIIMAGYDRIIKSVDNGETFTESIYIYNQIMLNYIFVDEYSGWAWDDNTIMRTTDAGANWSTFYLPEQPADIHFFDKLNGFMTSKAAGVKSFYKTTNGGITWVSIYSGINMQNASIRFFNNSTGYIVTSETSLFTSDKGNTWNPRNIKRIDLVKNGIGINYYFDWTNQIASFTADFGETWNDIYIPAKYFFAAYDMIDSMTFFTSGKYGTLFKTTDAGLNWKILTPPTFTLSNGFFVDDNHGWINGDHLMRTTNGGITWNITLIRDQLLQVWFLDRYNGFGVTRKSYDNLNKQFSLIRTTDRGDTWDTLHTFIDTYDKNIYFKDQKTGFINGGNVFGLTTDGGITWDFSNPHNLGGGKMFFLDSLKWYLINSVSGFRTVDGGNTWLPMPSLAGHDIFVIDSLNMLKARRHGLYRSSDGGNNFSELFDHGQDCSFSNFSFVNPEEGYVVWNGHSEIMKTTDGGNNWFMFFSAYTNENYIEYFRSSILSSKLMYVYGNTYNGLGRILKYTDEVIPVELTSFSATRKEGNVIINWSTASETNNKGFSLLRSNGTDESEIAYIKGAGTTPSGNNYSYTDLVPGNGSYIYKLIQEDFDGTRTELGEERILIDIPLEFVLFQNYPNPFNPSTKIKFSIPETSHSELIIYDAIGREAAILLDEIKEPGTYEINFNGKALPSGIYFYKLKAGNYSETKKLMLLK